MKKRLFALFLSILVLFNIMFSFRIHKVMASDTVSDDLTIVTLMELLILQGVPKPTNANDNMKLQNLAEQIKKQADAQGIKIQKNVTGAVVVTTALFNLEKSIISALKTSPVTSLADTLRSTVMSSLNTYSPSIKTIDSYTVTDASSSIIFYVSLADGTVHNCGTSYGYKVGDVIKVVGFDSSYLYLQTNSTAWKLHYIATNAVYPFISVDTVSVPSVPNIQVDETGSFPQGVNINLSAFPGIGDCVPDGTADIGISNTGTIAVPNDIIAKPVDHTTVAVSSPIQETPPTNSTPADSNFWSGLWDFLKAILAALVALGGIPALIQTIITDVEKIPSLILGIPGAISGFFDNVVSSVNALPSAFSTYFDKVLGSISAIPGTFQNLFNDLGADVLSIPTAIATAVTSVISAIKAIPTTFTDFFTNTISAVNAIPLELEGIAVGDMSVDFTPVEVAFSDKFPFCIPFDLIATFRNFTITAEAPKFQMTFPSLNLGNNFTLVEGHFEWDFSKFNGIVKVWRYFLLLDFCVALIILTRNIIKG